MRRVVGTSGVLWLLFLLAEVPSAQAQLALTTDSVPVTIDFTGWSGTGLDPSPAAGHLDSDTWRIYGLAAPAMSFSDTKTVAPFNGGANAGTAATAALYNWTGPTTNPTLGARSA
jgi:hypothetical protein